MSYEWAKIPEDLPKENLIFITAKTTAPTIHKDYPDPKYRIRIFKENELADAGSSLRKRPMGLNHLYLIEKGFTVDSQYNPKTKSLEALCYLPTDYITLIKKEIAENRRVQFSVEYNFRDAVMTEEGAELHGLCFHRVDLLLGVNGGDHYTSMKFVESETEHNGFLEAEIIPINEVNEMSEGTNLKESEELKETKATVKSLTTAVEVLSNEKSTLSKTLEEKETAIKELSSTKENLEKTLKEKEEAFTKLDTDFKELDKVATKAQENIKNFEEEKKKAISQAIVEGKKELAEKVLKVVPKEAFVSGPAKGALFLAREVITTIKQEVPFQE